MNPTHNQLPVHIGRRLVLGKAENCLSQCGKSTRKVRACPRARQACWEYSPRVGSLPEGKPASDHCWTCAGTCMWHQPELRKREWEGVSDREGAWTQSSLPREAGMVVCAARAEWPWRTSSQSQITGFRNCAVGTPPSPSPSTALQGPHAAHSRKDPGWGTSYRRASEAMVVPLS